jgi:hypothetical protein
MKFIAMKSSDDQVYALRCFGGNTINFSPEKRLGSVRKFVGEVEARKGGEVTEMKIQSLGFEIGGVDEVEAGANEAGTQTAFDCRFFSCVPSSSFD